MGTFGGLDLQELVVDVMQPTLRKTPFSGDGWLFEPKWDGFRAICYMQEGRLDFFHGITEPYREMSGASIDRERG